MDTTYLESSAVRPSPPGPRICTYANLPAFETEAELAAYQREVAGEHPGSVLVKWKCHKCRCWHYWSVGQTDSNGKFQSGASVVPARILKLVNESRVYNKT